jgi:UPF0755 protein
MLNQVGFIDKGMNSYELVKQYRSNVPVKLAFNNQERENGRVGSQIEADSLSLLNSLKILFFKGKWFSMKIMLMAMFIPNTYETYLNTSAEV